MLKSSVKDKFLIDKASRAICPDFVALPRI
jgi:hypothetical protein